MSKKRIGHLIILNITIIIVNIIVFAKPFLGLSLLEGTAFSLACGWTALAMSVAVFIYGHARIMRREKTLSLTQDIGNLDACIPVLEASHQMKTFAAKIDEIIDQIRRFRKKAATINDILLQKFSSEELTYRRFAGVLSEVDRVVYANVRSILNKISAFDEHEYAQLTHKDWRADALTREKMQIFQEYISFVDDAVGDNEQILLKLDKMLLAISRYNSLENGDIEAMPAMLEMDDLIKHAGLYK